MHLIRDMFFIGKDLKKPETIQTILSNPSHWVEILDFIWDQMKKDSEYELEKKWLEMKYEHDMRELKERYEEDCLDANV